MKNIRISQLSVIEDHVISNQVSTIAECSIANNGPQILVTGNWFAASSLNGGRKWSYISPFSNFPQADDGFCCDQTVIYDASRDITCWLLQYGALNGTNTLRLAVKKGMSLKQIEDWAFWDIVPVNLNPDWKNRWLDYNHAALSDNFLYVGANMFNTADSFMLGLVIRIPLDGLAGKLPVSFEYFESKDFSLRCVQGATDAMYFAAHGPSDNNDRIRVYSWAENEKQVSQSDIAITPWSAGRYRASCPDNRNWLSRADYRITGAWLSRGIIGLMWTAGKRGNERPFPHIRVVRIDAATMQRIDEPDIWSPDFAFAYPDACPNQKGEVGITMFYGGGLHFPTHAVGIFNETAQDWRIKTVRAGTHAPGGAKWGDYITIRPWFPVQKEWMAVGFTLQGGSRPENVSVHVVRFSGRN